MKLLIIIILLILVGGLWLYSSYFIAPPGDENNPVPSVSPSAESPLSVANQRPGSFVIVASVNINKEGYAVVYENNQGLPGRILGNSKILPAGKSSDVFVGLIRAVAAGEYLFVVIHEDSGDGIFTPSIDLPLKDDEGNLVSAYFGVGN